VSTVVYTETTAEKSIKLGVSVLYLAKHLEGDIENALGDDYSASCNFRDLKKQFWGGGLHSSLGFKCSQDLECPRDLRRGCAIVDALDTLDMDFAKTATHYLSWCWDYKLVDFVSAFRLLWSHNRSPGIPYVWVCFMCNNQRLYLLERDKAVNMADVFDTILDHIAKINGHVFILLNHYVEPVYVQRIWCIYETFRCSMRGIRMSVVFPEPVQNAIAAEISSGHFRRIRDSVAEINAEKATATYQSDEDMIKSCIRDTTFGFSGVNTVVRTSLRDGIGAIISELLDPRSDLSISSAEVWRTSQRSTPATKTQQL